MKILGLNVTRAHGNERKESETWRAIMSLYSGRAAVYTPKNYAALAQAGYQLCSTSYSCVSLIARSASGIKWTVGKRQRDGSVVEVDNHPLLDLLARPNEYDSGYRFVESIISHKLLAGNAYVEKAHGLKSAPPRFLYALRPDRMTITPGDSKGMVAAYAYNVNGRTTPLDRENILHLKDFHPLDDFYGLSRVEVAATSIDISNASQEWNLKHLQNDMHLSGLLTLKGLSNEQSELIRQQFQDKYQGSANAGKVAVLENIDESDFKTLSMTPRDADWGESDKRNLRRICAVFNVWSGLLGDSENTTYSNFQEGRRALYQEAVLPEMDGLCDAFNHFLAPLYGDGIVLGYDRDAIEALQEDREKKYSYLAGANWLTVNEKRTACGYGEIPEGDVVLVGLGDASLADMTAPAGELSATDKSVTRGGRKSIGRFWSGAEERKALWQNFERRITAKEKAFAREAEAWLKSQAASAAARVRGGAQTADEALDAPAAVASYVEKFLPRYRKLYATARIAGRRMTEGKFYDFAEDEKADGGWVDEATRKRLERLIEESAKVITDETLAEIQAVMRDSLNTNLTVQEIANAISDKVGDAMAPMRARRIARTETGMLENQGNLDGFREDEFVTKKGWLCSFVEDSRDAHMDADGQEVGIDEPFRVGKDEMDYPLDRSHNPSAGNVVNCLCAIYPITE